MEAEECGILDGCAHGRCVRVPEGFTCDCFSGYRLDMTRMACVGEGRPGPACAGRGWKLGRGGDVRNIRGSSQTRGSRKELLHRDGACQQKVRSGCEDLRDLAWA